MTSPCLKDLSLAIEYATDSNDMVSEFYVPCLSIAHLYERAVGYFTSGSLALLTNGIAALVQRGGHIRVVCSPHLSREDLDALNEGLRQREEVVEDALIRPIVNSDGISCLTRDRLSLLTWLIANDHLELRIALGRHEDGRYRLYHEKVGVIWDDHEHYLTWGGSPNETGSSVEDNIESFLLFRSWSQGELHQYAERNRDRFRRTWNGERRLVEVMDLPRAVRDCLFEKYKPHSPNRNRITRPMPETIAEPSPGVGVYVPEHIHLYGYQLEAIRNWLKLGLQGIYALATGTGKTITALASAVQLAHMAATKDRKTAYLLVVVVCPSTTLVKQWTQEARAFGFEPVPCYSETRTNWPEQARFLIGEAKRIRNVGMLVTTGDTLAGEGFQSILRSYEGHLLIIADEVHSYGTSRLLAALPHHAQYRLGLSATPERHRDQEGTSQLLDYFGKVALEVSLKEAIWNHDALVHYNYRPVVVDLTDDEFEEYVRLAKQIAQEVARGASIETATGQGESRLDRLLFRRAQLIGHATRKLAKLAGLIVGNYQDSNYILVYCAEGAHPLEQNGIRQMTKVTRLLGNTYGMNVGDYWTDTDQEERAQRIQDLRTGRLQALVSMRCLDEGVDIPEVQTAFILASTTNPRQFVQRRGRILRKSRLTSKQHAEIYDFLVIPDVSDESLWALERSLVGRELARAFQLADAADNEAEARAHLMTYVREYRLYDIV